MLYGAHDSDDGSPWRARSAAQAFADGVLVRRRHRRPGHLALVYAYYTPGSCAKGACTLGVSFVQSPDGGASWTKPLRLDVEPMQMQWLPLAEGRMVGDYFASAFAGDRVVPVFTLAIEPTDGRLHEAIFASSLKPLG